MAPFVTGIYSIIFPGLRAPHKPCSGKVGLFSNTLLTDLQRWPVWYMVKRDVIKNTGMEFA